jgi:hypothetical protein
MTQGLIIKHDNDRDQGFLNSDERDITDTTHAYFENANILAKFRLGLTLEELTSHLVTT